MGNTAHHRDNCSDGGDVTAFMDILCQKHGGTGIVRTGHCTGDCVRAGGCCRRKLTDGEIEDILKACI